MTTTTSPGLEQERNLVTSPARSIVFYAADVAESDLATREIENEPALYRNVLARLSTPSVLIPADEAMEQATDQT